MSVKLKPLNQQVIVITGATSGIGLATAKAAAKAGARLVLAARSQNDLNTVARDLGSNVVTVAADVADPEAVRRIHEAAHAKFGGFDTWVNNAGVGMWGKLSQGNLEDFKRLYDTNFWGIVNGSLEAIKHLKKHGGALINLGSEVSDVSVPVQGMYASSKHAVKGFTDALRIELADEKAPVSVTLIKPAAINTPFPEHARNYLSEKPKLPQPVYAPEEVAKAILHAASHPVRDIYVGGGGKLMSTINKFAPSALDWLEAKTGVAQQKQENTKAVNPAGSLHSPAAPHAKVHGNNPGHVMKTSLYTHASIHPVVAGVVVATGLAAGIALVAGRKRNMRDAGFPVESGTKEPLVPATDE
ncbi:SDR family NAD(P)-dependent oxidoreductase [Hymenobacter sp. HMF4947]|uniref:SDR family NAD(P)-dependent oxidoreductase n=1 Tax=Hymenobacter ginkgonis TaxID=2682976 RepID=A0A7K1TG87_9BACT|nr:SDR family oxidoreductase [Hymenobacter ginkgonis]MVN77389.1 SDR family NAD(P)-dependent oxidoreductase [Hymenobacter ginkgonis]